MAEANGIYSRLRYLRISLSNDREHFESAPLGKAAREELATRIANQEADLKKLNAQHRAYLKGRKNP